MNLIKFLRENNIVSYYNLDELNINNFSMYIGNNITSHLLTDGNLELNCSHYDERIHLKDSFIPSNIEIKNYEFLISNAKFVLINKNINGKLIRDLYMSLEYIDSLDKIGDSIYKEVNINVEGKVKTKSLRGKIWK